MPWLAGCGEWGAAEGNDRDAAPLPGAAAAGGCARACFESSIAPQQRLPRTVYFTARDCFVSQGFYQHFPRNNLLRRRWGRNQREMRVPAAAGAGDAGLTSRRSRSGEGRGALRRRRVRPVQDDGGGRGGRVWGVGVSRSSFPASIGRGREGRRKRRRPRRRTREKSA